ncbi:hypothetical protein BC940DRAFT_310650 [Gongronella butleri]|nr:hypothetical protein BC940DRAFT_310650 [Gongronella butleri]
MLSGMSGLSCHFFFFNFSLLVPYFRSIAPFYNEQHRRDPQQDKPIEIQGGRSRLVSTPVFPVVKSSQFTMVHPKKSRRPRSHTLKRCGCACEKRQSPCVVRKN